jgi:gamma-glutamylcyclotransferase (GGCT)/AIG2-like uncharacterized protein YtfP
MLLYFAYASNLDRAHMRKLCPRAEPLGRALLKHHAFFVAAGGYGSISPRRNSLVHGVLWRVTARDIAALDDYESVGAGLYRKKGHPVHFGAKLLRALVYVANDATPGRPRARYREIVLAAARGWDFPADYLQRMERALAPLPQ